MKKVIIIAAILAALYLVLQDNNTTEMPQTTLQNPNHNQMERKPLIQYQP